MRNPEETRRRLLVAATKEFSAYGIAGARVDRIAEAAGCNKQSIYGHYKSKEGLFDAVFDAMVVQTVSSVPLDASDLPGYATRLFDWYRDHPEVLRLATWQLLERGAQSEPSEAMALANAEKVAKIRGAQEAGAVTNSLPAEHLLALILRMSTAQLEAERGGRGEGKQLRAALAEAVRRLVAV